MSEIPTKTKPQDTVIARLVTPGGGGIQVKMVVDADAEIFEDRIEADLKAGFPEWFEGVDLSELRFGLARLPFYEDADGEVGAD